jgi:hypothetical protein
MKTPMQELIERLNNVKPTEFCSIETIKGWAESMLEKEKEQIVNAWIDDRFPLDKDWVRQCAEKYYEETYGGNK